MASSWKEYKQQVERTSNISGSWDDYKNGGATKRAAEQKYLNEYHQATAAIANQKRLETVKTQQAEAQKKYTTGVTKLAERFGDSISGTAGIASIKKRIDDIDKSFLDRGNSSYSQSIPNSALRTERDFLSSARDTILSDAKKKWDDARSKIDINLRSSDYNKARQDEQEKKSIYQYLYASLIGGDIDQAKKEYEDALYRAQHDFSIDPAVGDRLAKEVEDKQFIFETLRDYMGAAEVEQKRLVMESAQMRHAKAYADWTDASINGADEAPFIEEASKADEEYQRIKAEYEKLYHDVYGNASYKEYIANAAFTGLGAQFVKSIFSTANLLADVIPAETGVGDAIRQGNNASSDWLDRMSYSTASSTRAMGESFLWQAGADLTTTMTNMIPHIVLAYMTGGASDAVSAAEITKINAQKGAKKLLSVCGNVAKTWMKDPGFWLTFAQEAGMDYEKAKEQGASDARAAAYGFLTGSVNAGIEVGFDGLSGIQGLPKMLVGAADSGNDAFVKAIIKTALSEGKEEVFQDLVEGINTAIIYGRNPEVTMFSLDDEEAAFNPLRTAKAGIMGFIAGGAMGAPALAGNRIAYNLSVRENDAAIADYVKSINGVQGIVETGLESPEGTESREIAEKLRQKASNPENLTNAEIASQYRANVAQIEAETAEETARQEEEKAQNRVAVSAEMESDLKAIGVDEDHAKEIIALYDEDSGLEPVNYVIAADEAYRAGRNQAPVNDLFAKTSLSKLSRDQILQVYSMGQELGDIRADEAQNTKITPNKEFTLAKGFKRISFDGNVNLDVDDGGKRTAELRFIDTMASIGGTTVHVYESYKNADGQTVYKDSDGVEQIAQYGMYRGNTDEIWVDLNDENGEHAAVMTFTHEMTHHIQRVDPVGYRIFSTRVAEAYGTKASVDAAVNSQIVNARNAGFGEEWIMKTRGVSEGEAYNVLYDTAYADFIADACDQLMTKGNFAEVVSSVENERPGFIQKVKKWLDKVVANLRKFYDSIKGQSAAGYILTQTERFEDLQKEFARLLVSSGEKVQSLSIEPGSEATITDANGNLVAKENEDGTVQLSLRTYEEEGRSLYETYLNKLVKNKQLSATDRDSMLQSIDDIYNVCKEFEGKYAQFGAWSRAEVVRDTYGKPVFSVVTPNGDYKMNLDFSLVCKKRRMLDAVLNEMSRRGIIDDFELGQKSVVKINEIIRSYKFETACALCFVDARRYRQAEVADSFVSLYNELVESLVPDSNSIEYFNFSGNVTRETVENAIHTWDNSRLDFSHINDVIRNYGEKTVEHKAAVYIKNNPKARKLLQRGDFMSKAAFDAVKTFDRGLLSIYNSKKGTGGPKASFGDTQYMSDIIKHAQWWTPKKAYAVGGVRVQSFSDYIPRMVFDYVQMVYDLAAAKLPAHAYTKEEIFVKQFGLSGIKINMSLIPAVASDGIAPGLDANGNYLWAGESFAYDKAIEIENTEGYSRNCGTIAVGVSDAHIRKLLADPNIRMVIPYHKSGLNPVVAHMNNVDAFENYTDYQTTKGKDGKTLKKDYAFNEVLHRVKDPKKATEMYLAWCEKNGYTPKFPMFRFNEDGTVNENYYKLLIDFTVYDVDGNYVAQEAVTPTFPKDSDKYGSMKTLIESGLEEDAIFEGRKNSELSKIVDEIEATLPRTEAEIPDEVVKQAATDLEAEFVQHSVRVTDRKTLDFLDEQLSRGEYDPKTNPNGGYYVTYKSMSFWGYDEGGNAILRSPMAEYVDGKLSDAYIVNKSGKPNWYKSTETLDEETGVPTGLILKVSDETLKRFPKSDIVTVAGAKFLVAYKHPEMIADDWSNCYFQLNKKVETGEFYKNGEPKYKNSPIPARYAPYEHSSNLMLNDQFESAWRRANLVTVKMYVPVSEANGASRTKYAKDSTGWTEWHSGVVAGSIKKPGFDRQVFLSNYAAPVEIVPDSEVAQAYKEYVSGTDVKVPDNVVSPSLLNELKKAGVPIRVTGKVKFVATNDYGLNQNDDIRYSLRNPDYQASYQAIKAESRVLDRDVSDFGEMLAAEKPSDLTAATITAAAERIARQFDTKGKKADLAILLGKFYRAVLDEGEAITWDSIRSNASDAVEWIQEHRAKEIDPDAKQILDDLRGAKIALNPTQVEEVKSRYGTYNDYRKQNFGSFTLTSKGVPLDSFWQEMSSKYPNVFDPDISDGDMPIRLAEIVSEMRTSYDLSREIYDPESAEYYQSVVVGLYDSLWESIAINSTNKRVNALKKAHKEQMDKLRQQRDERIKKIQQKNRESRETAAEKRRKTIIRNKIQRVTDDLNRMLLHGNKKKHIPEGLRSSVAKALGIINMDTIGAGERVAKYNELIADATSPEEIERLTNTRDRIEAQGERLSTALAELKVAYDAIQSDQDANIRSIYDSVISAQIQKTFDDVGNTSLREMTEEQLDEVYKMFRMVRKAVTNENRMFYENKRYTVETLSSMAMREIEQHGVGKTIDPKSFANTVNRYGWNYLKPYVAMKVIGSDTLSALYERIRAGEGVWYEDVNDAAEFYRGKRKQYNASKWNENETVEFTDANGKKFRLNLGQRMSLYAYIRRDYARRHLETGGFVYDGASIEDENGKKIVPSTVVNYIFNTDVENAITESLSKDQRHYVEDMQDYLSNTMGEKGNEVSMQLYDVKLFRELMYFPMRTSDRQREIVYETSQRGASIKNYGFTNEPIPSANNSLVLSNFNDTWANHVNQMSNYHAFVLPLDDFTRVFNYETHGDGAATGVRSSIYTEFGTRNAENYVAQLLRDINGGVRVEDRVGVGGTMTALMKRSRTMASLSVTIQQISSIARATALIDPKYFTGKRVSVDQAQRSWDQIIKYAPIAGIKQLGYFDIGMGRSTASIITEDRPGTIKEKAKAFFAKDGAYRDEVFTFLPNFMDQVGWTIIWDAVKREVAGRSVHPEINSEEFLRVCGKRFEEVIQYTQVYDSVFSRNSMMRDGDKFSKMVTAFMAEPTTTANMVILSTVESKRSGNAKPLARTLASVVASVIFNSVLVALPYAMRDKDEEKNFGEKYVSSLVENVVDNLNPVTYFPFLRDVWKIAEGYDVERADLDMISDLLMSLRNIATMIWKIESGSVGEEEGKRALVDYAIDALAMLPDFTGIPVTNIVREIRAGINTIQTVSRKSEIPTSAGMWNAVRESLPFQQTVSNKQQLFEAMVSGNEKQIARVSARYKDESSLNTAIQEALKQHEPRIREAALANIDGDLKRYDEILNEIVDEGHFARNRVIGAINSMVNKLSPDEEETDTYTDKAKAAYTTEQYINALVSGDPVSTIIRDDILYSKTENGKTQQEAEKSLNDSVTNKLRDLVRDGTIDPDAAERILVQNTGANANDAYLKVKGWTSDDGTVNVYNDLERALWANKNVLSARKDLVSHGYKDDTVNDRIIKALQEMFWGEKDGYGKLSKDAAIKRLTAYAGMNAEEANSTLREWTSFVVTGEKVEDVKEDYIGGEIDRAKAMDVLTTYAGYTASEASDTLRAYEWQRKFANRSEVSVKLVNNYYTYVEQTGVTQEEFNDFVKNCNGKNKDEVIDYISGTNLTPPQKDELYLSFGYDRKKLSELPW